MLICKLMLPIAWVLIIGLLLVASAIATLPNYSGTWVRDAAKSGPFTAVVGTRSSLPDSVTFVLNIEHDGKILKIEAKQDGQKTKWIKYNLGRAWLSAGWHGDIPPKLGGTRHRARWNGVNLVIEKNAIYSGDYGDLVTGWRQEWVLSPGGTVLTIITKTFQRGALHITTKEVFNRK